MKHAAPKKDAHPARPIKTKRDHSGATAAAKRLAAQAAHDAEAEKRLQSLLHELDKFEDVGDDDEEGSSDGYDYSGPSRRWSDASDDA